MAAVPNGSGSTVRVSTEFTVAGRAATFGRGLTMAKPPRRYSRLGLANRLLCLDLGDGTA